MFFQDNIYTIDYVSAYGMRYRIYLHKEKMLSILPDLDAIDEEDRWYNCSHDKLANKRRDIPRDLSNIEEKVFLYDEYNRIIENPDYKPANKNCKKCHPKRGLLNNILLKDW